MFRSIATAALIALSVTAAQAGEVRFGDLDLSSNRDIATLNSRIAKAAAQDCAVKLDFGVSAALAYQAGREEKACIARASAQTLAKVQTMASLAHATRLARQ